MSARKRASLHRCSRRAWLRSVGASGALAPFVPVAVGAAQERAPKRLVLWLVPDGFRDTSGSTWKPANGSHLGRVFSPLAPFASKVLVAGNVRSRMTERRNVSNHYNGMASAFTGCSNTLDDCSDDCQRANANGPSIDQVLARELRPATQYDTLELGVRPAQSHKASTRMIYAGPQNALAPQGDPYQLFDDLFGAGELDSTAIERTRRRRSSVIDLVRGELRTLQRAFGTAEHRKFEAHLESLRSIERRLDGSQISCESPRPDGRLDPLENDNYPEVGKLQIDLAVNALACDLTRFLSMEWSNSGDGGVTHRWLGINRERHRVAHGREGDNIERINTWYSEQFAYFLERLESVPEGDGTMLDHTLILWGREFGYGGDEHAPFPNVWVVAGGGATGIRSGRYVDFDGGSHNQLLVATAQAFGLGVDRFGDLDPGEGRFDWG